MTRQTTQAVSSFLALLDQPEEVEKPKFSRRRELWRMLDEPGYNTSAQVFFCTVFGTILVSILNFVISSFAKDLCGWENGWLPNATRTCSSSRVGDYDWTKHVEMICIIIFSIEFALRLLTCVCPPESLARVVPR